MTTHAMNPEFDQYAAEYDAALAQGLAVSGEAKEFFAHGRIQWLAGCLRKMQIQPRSVMDFGCGTGSATPFFQELLNSPEITGVDVSSKSLNVARQQYGAKSTQFMLLDEYQPNSEVDLAFCNGVFHHIPINDRAGAVDYVYRSLRPGGLFAFWENNPWNPGTRLVMKRCAFDADAVTLTPPEARGLLKQGGFEVISTNFMFIFPKVLKVLRPLEPSVASLPIGAQYQILCRKP